MTRGQEQYCQGLIDADNRNGEKYEEAARFFKEAKAITANWKPLEPAQVALVYDYDNIRSWHEQPQSEAMNFTDEFVRLYQGFHRLNVPVAVLDLKKDFSSYTVVVLPVMQIVTPELEKRLKDYVEQGGCLVSGFRLGIKDTHNNLKLAQVVPGGLTDLFGCEVVGYESLYEGLTVPVAGKLGEGTYVVWRDLIQSIGAEILLAYQDEFYKGYAAATLHQYGKGHAVYIGGGLSEDLTLKLCTNVCKMMKIQTIHSPKGVEVVIRETTDGIKQRVVLNHLEVPMAFEGHVIPPFDVIFL